MNGTPPLIPADWTIAHAPTAITATLDGETVVFDGASGDFTELNGSAARIWDLLREPKTLVDLLEEVARLFDISPAACEVDVRAWLQEMAKRGLLTLQPVSSPERGTASAK